jgi:hypothetical protein
MVLLLSAMLQILSTWGPWTGELDLGRSGREGTVESSLRNPCWVGGAANRRRCSTRTRGRFPAKTSNRTVSFYK